MNEHELRALIRSIVAEVLKAHTQSPTAPPRKKALVMFSGALLGFEAALESLTRLSGEIELHWTQTPSAQRILDQDKIAALGMTPVSQSLVESHDILIVPTLTVNAVAKIAHGIGDCLTSNVLAEFIMSGRPIVAAVNAACPDSKDKHSWFPNAPEPYRKVLRNNLAALKSFGVTLTTAELLDAEVRLLLGAPETQPRAVPEVTQPPVLRAVPSEPVFCATTGVCADWVGDYPDQTMDDPPIGLTERVVHDAMLRGIGEGTVVCVGRSAVITPLAKETARERNIRIERVG